MGPSTPGTQRILDFFAALTHGALMGQISSPFPWLGPTGKQTTLDALTLRTRSAALASGLRFKSRSFPFGSKRTRSLTPLVHSVTSLLLGVVCEDDSCPFLKCDKRGCTSHT